VGRSEFSQCSLIFPSGSTSTLGESFCGTKARSERKRNVIGVS
jgi:hypothetical protein